MKEELIHRKLNFFTERNIPVIYKNRELEVNFRCDLFVEEGIVVELKSVLDMSPMF